MINRKLLPLAAELQKTAYSGLTDQQAADLLNAEVATGDYQSHNITDRGLDALFGLTRSAEIMAGLDAASAAGSIAAGRIAAGRIAELLRDRAGDGLDLGTATAMTELPDMVTAGIITQTESDQLLALVQVIRSPAQRLVNRLVPVTWVTNIRAAIAAGEV